MKRFCIQTLFSPLCIQDFLLEFCFQKGNQTGLEKTKRQWPARPYTSRVSEEVIDGRTRPAYLINKLLLSSSTLLLWIGSTHHTCIWFNAFNLVNWSQENTAIPPISSQGTVLLLPHVLVCETSYELIMYPRLFTSYLANN